MGKQGKVGKIVMRHGEPGTPGPALVREDRVMLNPRDCYWLCPNCASKKPMVGATTEAGVASMVNMPAFPWCICGARMTMLSAPSLGYVEDGRK